MKMDESGWKWPAFNKIIFGILFHFWAVLVFVNSIKITANTETAMLSNCQLCSLYFIWIPIKMHRVFYFVIERKKRNFMVILATALQDWQIQYWNVRPLGNLRFLKSKILQFRNTQTFAHQTMFFFLQFLHFTKSVGKKTNLQCTGWFF